MLITRKISYVKNSYVSESFYLPTFIDEKLRIITSLLESLNRGESITTVAVWYLCISTTKAKIFSFVNNFSILPVRKIG